MTNPARAPSDPAPDGLRRSLGLATATALVVGEVIGVGIFLTPAGMARSLGSPFVLFGVWVVMGAIALAGAISFGGLAARFPQAGGGYVYLRQAYGPLPAFLFGWLSLGVTDPGITAALAVGLAGYVGYLVPLATPLAAKAVAVGAIVLLAAVNILGVGLGAAVLRGLSLLKVALIAAIVLWGFALGRGDWSNFVPFVAQRPGSDPLPGALVGALIAAFFSFGGWWDLSKIAGEVCDPGRTLPRALILGVSTVTVVYLLISAVFLYLVPPAYITSDRAFAALAGEALFGRSGGVVFAIIVVFAVVGSLAGILMAAPRVYYAMARDGLFFPSIAEVHPWLGTPARAIGLQAVLASILVASGTFDQILAYFIFATVAFLVLIVSTVFALGVRVPGHPFTPLGFLVPCMGLLVLLALQNPKQSLLGLGVVILGVPVYGLAFARNRPARAEAAPDLSTSTSTTHSTRKEISLGLDQDHST